MLSWIYDAWNSFIGHITTHHPLHKTIEEETGDVYFRRDDGSGKDGKGKKATGGSIDWKATEHLKQLPEALDAPTLELESSIVTAMAITENSTSEKSISIHSPIENARDIH